MNVFDKLSRWWEGRKVVRKAEFDELSKSVLAKLDDDKKTNIATRLTELIIRMDRLELYVGLKRDAKPVAVPGEARIS